MNFIMRVLQVAVEYDQLNLAELASFTADVLAQLKDLGRKREALVLTSRLEARAAPRPRDSPKRVRDVALSSHAHSLSRFPPPFLFRVSHFPIGM